MTVSSSLLVVVLTVVSVASLSLLSLLCLRCRRKSKIKEVERQIYDPQTFQRGGSKFAVMRSKTVTRINQMTSTTPESPDEFASPGDQTVSSSLEHDYVAPIAVSVYANEPIGGMMADYNQTPPDYENIFSSLPIADDEDDYENSQYLNQVQAQLEDSKSRTRLCKRPSPVQHRNQCVRGLVLSLCGLVWSVCISFCVCFCLFCVCFYWFGSI
ncbi:uncharacterized protein LOC111563007 isoform X2 [Amphiprion ocellaris]|nr:uncharacterized protein LOC111563007 isoform X2 [Amphiprion ocellaris]